MHARAVRVRKALFALHARVQVYLSIPVLAYFTSLAGIDRVTRAPKRASTYVCSHCKRRILLLSVTSVVRSFLNQRFTFSTCTNRDYPPARLQCLLEVPVTILKRKRMLLITGPVAFGIFIRPLILPPENVLASMQFCTVVKPTLEGLGA